MDRQVAIYARISLDRTGGEGVSRQLDDCRALAHQRGWTEVVEYVDNDVSAFQAKHRPAYERLLDDLRTGRVGAVVAYHPDRLYRRTRDLEDFIDAVSAAGAEVATVRAGDVDLATASGRMVARILGSVSRHESERMGERIARAKKERAITGRPAGGGKRPYGLTADRSGLVEVEAETLRSVARAVLSGSSFYAEVQRLNESGLFTTEGNPWSVQTLRRVLCSPYVAGLRAYKGEVVGLTVSPPILDRDTFDAIRAITAGRPGRRPSGRYLLTGLISCGLCGRPLWSKRAKRHAAYACMVTTAGGCGRLSIVMSQTDAHVVERIGSWFTPEAEAAYQAWAAGADDPEIAAELAEVKRQELVNMQRWAAGEWDDDRHDLAERVLRERRRGLEERAVSRPKLGVRFVDLARVWQVMTVEERRSVIAGLAAQPIVIGPGRGGGRIVPVPERVGLSPVWS